MNSKNLHPAGFSKRRIRYTPGLGFATARKLAAHAGRPWPACPSGEAH